MEQPSGPIQRAGRVLVAVAFTFAPGVAAALGAPPPYTKWNGTFFVLGSLGLIGVAGFILSFVLRTVFKRRADAVRTRTWTRIAWIAVSLGLVSMLLYLAIYQFLYLPEYREFNGLQ